MTEVAGRVTAPSEPTPATLAGRVRAPLGVAFARLKARPGRALLVALGVAASTAVLAAAFGASVVARDRAVQRALSDLPTSDRSFRVDLFGLPIDTTYARADREARTALSRLAPGTPLRGTFFRELRIDGELTQLAGLDGVARLVKLRSGRLPRVCRPARCEVLQIGRGGKARLDEGGIHLVRVGLGDVPGRAIFGASIDTERQGGENPTLLLAAGARAFEHLPAFDGLYRVYAWIAPLDPRRLHIWQIGSVLARETEAQTQLARAGDVYQLSGPDQALTDARAAGRVASQRMLLIGGEASALLLGFALITAMGLRRGLANERRRLLQRGARRLQVWLSETAEVAATTVGGALAGAAAGVVGIVVIADAAGLPGGAVLAHSLASSASVGALVALWLAATVTVLAGAHVRDTDTPARRVRIIDVLALGAAAAVTFGLARGGLDAQALSSGGDRGLLLALPLLVSFVAAVAAVRLLAPTTRLGERLARRSSVPVRLALLALSRAPVRTTATAAFLLVSLGLGLFASSWRATIERGARDQAAFAVPLDFTLTEGQRLVLPLDAAPLSRYDAVAPGVRAYPVLRRSADVAGVGTSVLSPTVLGLAPDALARLHWRGDFASLGPGELARRIGAVGRVAGAGVPLPAGTRRLALDVVLRGVPVELALAVRDAHGRTSTVSLGERPAGTWRLSASVPATARQLLGLEVSLAAAEQLGVNHRETGAEESTTASGAATISPLEARTAGGGTATVTGWRGFLPRAGLRVRSGARPQLSYAFTQGQTMLLRVRQPTDGRVLPVVASPDVARSAGPGGSLVLDFQDVRIPARVVAVASRFPASDQQGEGFVVGDESWLANALDADAPGTGMPDELWLAAPARADATVTRALRRAPFDSLVVSSRRALQRSLESDPLARGITLSLAGAAIAALALTLVGFWIALLSELRDERGELFDLEAQGVAPAMLRRQLRIRAAALVLFGSVGGVVLGLVLSRLVVAVVRVSGTTAPPNPPLRLDVPWAVAGIGTAATLVALAAVVELTTRNAFRADSPERASWSLE